MLTTRWQDKSYLEMENRQKVLNLLGLAQRANKLVTGEQLVLKQVRTKKAYLVFIASDGGQSTHKKISDKCHSYGVALSSDFSQLELSTAIGQKRSLIAVTDLGFSKKMRQLLA